MHILIHIRRILECQDTALPSLCYTTHGATKFDFLTLLDFVERSCNLLDYTIHHSPSAVKGNILFKGFCADIRERVHLANIHLSVPSGTSGDASRKDIGPILDAIRRAMDDTARSSDPPPLLCEEIEGRRHEYSRVSNRQGQMSQATNLEITDTSGNREVEVEAGYNMLRKLMLRLSLSSVGCTLGLHPGIRNFRRIFLSLTKINSLKLTGT
ncbi:hypothetical protein V1505DRAFT_402131 [Lipomyces doorenjongii]